MGFKSRSGKLKTQPTDVSAASFIGDVADERRRRECQTLLEIMSEASGEPPVMWGPSIIGFGKYRYKYPSGREGEWPRTGFSPRKQALTVYCIPGFKTQSDLLAKLGPHSTGSSCLYIRKLEDVDLGVLRQIVDRALAHMAKTYPA